MTGSAAHKWYVIALALLALLLATAAGAAQLFKWEGPRAVTLGLAALAVGAIAVIVEKVIVPRIDVGRAREEDTQRSRAVMLELTRGDGGRFGLAVLNKDLYEVTDVRIECWPRGGPPGTPLHSPGELDRWRDHQVTYTPIAGGGQLIEVPKLTPPPDSETATGIILGSWVLAPGASTRMEFQVDWLDHQGRGRRLVGASDLDDVTPIDWVALEPPKPLTTSPSWWGRLRRTLGRRVSSTATDR